MLLIQQDLPLLTGIVSYTSRTSTQFLGCTNIIEPLLDGDDIADRNFYSQKNLMIQMLLPLDWDLS